MKLPKLIKYEQQDQTLKFSLEICSDLIWFKGHFDNYPILPAIAQIHFAKYFANAFFLERLELNADALLELLAQKEELVVTKLTRMKFIKPIEPNNIVNLTLDYNEAKGSISFHYQDENNVTYSQGNMLISKA